MLRSCRTATLAAAALLISAASSSIAQEIPGLPAAGGQAAPAGTADPTSAEEIAARRAELAQELASADEAVAAALDSSRRAHLEQMRDQLREVDSLLRKQGELVAAPPPEPPAAAEPAEQLASVFALNDLYEARGDAAQRASWLAEALAARREALANAREKLEEAERERRKARSEVEAADGPEAKSLAEQTLELRVVASRAAQERVYLRTLEARIAADAQQGVGETSDLDARIAAMRDAIRRGEGASSEGFAALTEEEGRLQRERQAAERRLATVELRLDAARQRFARQADPAKPLLDEVEALTATRDAVRLEISLLEGQLERLDGQRQVWRDWESLLQGEGTREEVAAQETALDERIRDLQSDEVHSTGQLGELGRRLQNLQERLARLPDDAASQPGLERQRTALDRVLDVARADAAALGAERRLSERVLGELRVRASDIRPVEYAVRALKSAHDAWSYEITTVDDAPITVGSLLLALLMAGVGLWAARYGSAFVGRVATERLRLDAGAAQALQSLSFYLLLVSFTLLALRAIHFPLTAFTVLGGALAIGIGFGSQNVMNNFISGLILMLERPVRAGDVVEVDANHGTIERIGARSTQIRSVDGRHIVVPNSFFLENNVVNWTLSDDLIRTSVLVGVIYGSPTRLVEELIRKVVDEDGQVLKQPEPILLFDEFGDNSLNFEVHFWVRARSPMAMKQVQSRLRFQIDDLFREHELVIAFPQRDVHLDSASPIEVELVNRGARSPEPTAG